MPSIAITSDTIGGGKGLKKEGGRGGGVTGQPVYLTTHLFGMAGTYIPANVTHPLFSTFLFRFS